MSKAELDNLVRIGKLKLEPASRVEFDGMVSSARTRLLDAQNESLDPDSQFDLAYGAAHRLALVTLRQLGYRSEDRISVFQTLVHTVGTDKADIQIFLRAHNERNLAEYEGRTDVNPQLLTDLIRCTKDVAGCGGKTRPTGQGIISSGFAAAGATTRRPKIGGSRAILLLSFFTDFCAGLTH
jgi:hypothetical protein